jgi:alanine racemase
LNSLRTPAFVLIHQFDHTIKMILHRIVGCIGTVVPIGYGDGYFRSLSNQAVVRLHGKAAPVCGRVSMDITDIPEAQVGDRVEVIAADASAPNSVENLAKLAGTIPYEITCHMGYKLRHLLVK